MGWKTRKRGSEFQKGQRFQTDTTPFLEPGNLPKKKPGAISDRSQVRSRDLTSHHTVEVELPENTTLITTTKEHNPTEVKLDAAVSPISGGPLAPPKEYGATITEDPYSGTYVYVTPPEHGQRVKPTYTEFTEKGKEIVKTEVQQAQREMAKGDMDSAYKRMIWIKSTIARAVPKEYRDKDPFLRKVNQTIGEAENYHYAAKTSSDPQEAAYYRKLFANELRDLSEIASKPEI
jgi:hypothetical protein